MNSKYKIAVIMTWFGKLPIYFPAWLEGAVNNSTIDFYCFVDNEFECNAKNIHVINTTMNDEIKRIATALHEDISIDNSYKFCDLRAFFGVGYEEYIKEYDFWAYCDIDMIFGDLRHFLTDDVLSRYDRFYEYGYLSIFRNNYQMKHLYELPGGIYTKDEIFRGKAKCTPEEQYGIYRISEINHIKWYRENNFADFHVPYSSFILNQRKNYQKQAFYWEDGHVYQVYVDLNGEVKKDELAFIHWQKRKPRIDEYAIESKSFFVTPISIETKKKGIPSEKEILKVNPILSSEELRKADKQYLRKKIKDFLRSSFAQKRIWLRQKKYYWQENRALIESKMR